MSMRRVTEAARTGRPSLLAQLFKRNSGRPAAPAAPAFFVEELECRVLLSHVPVATHDFVLLRATGAAWPAAVAGPRGLSPALLDQAYGVDLVRFGSIVGDGAGQTIAIVDAYNDPTIAADLRTFDAQFGLPDPPSFTVISQTGSTRLPRTDPAGKGDSWAVEISLDVEWAHAVAPLASIVLVEANSASLTNLLAAVNTARRYPGVSVVSMSWGGGEFSGQSSYDSYFTTPAGHNGVTFVASSGDYGAYNPYTTTVAASYPATSPNVLAAGGAYLMTDSSGNYLSESGWGSGASSGYYGGSGGGISRYVAQPVYQHGLVTQSATLRTFPDVAFDASPSSGVAVIDSWDFGSSPWVTIGGTSLAAPLWAGVIATADQGRVLAGLGTLDGASQTLPMIYALPSTDFHDITTGNNGYPAGGGYDLVTGRGTPIVNLVVADLVGQPNPVPAIGSLTANPSAVAAGATVTLTAANVREPDGTISEVAFYLESDGSGGLQIGLDTFLGDGTQSGTAWSLSSFSTAGLAPGNYTLYAVATDGAGLTSGPAAASLDLLVPPPANDGFAAAAVLSGTSPTATGTNVGATKEPGEPNHAGNAGGASVWYAWTAPASGKVSLNTSGSSFDTTLAVYTGGSVSGLAAVAGNDDASYATLTSALTFNAVKGVTYRIAVDGYKGATGNMALNLLLAAAPANDAFANAAALSGNTLAWAGTNVGATREPGEPYLRGNIGGASVWFTWTAPTTGAVSLNTHGSSFDTLLGVYTGSSASGLTLVASNDDDTANRTLTSALTFNAVAGVTYHFVIDGYNGATGNIVLNLA